MLEQVAVKKEPENQNMLDILKIDPLSSQHTRDAVMKKFGLLPDVSELTERRKRALQKYHESHLQSAKALERNLDTRYQLIKERRAELSPDYTNPVKTNMDFKIAEGLKRQLMVQKKLDSARGIDLFEKKYRKSHESVSKLNLGNSTFLRTLKTHKSPDTKSHRMTLSM